MTYYEIYGFMRVAIAFLECTLYGIANYDRDEPDAYQPNIYDYIK